MADRSPTVADLHRLAIGLGWPARDAHDMLHDWAVRLWPVTSLTELGPEERIAFAHQIRLGSRGASTPRVPNVYRSKPRPRRGHVPEPGVIRLASPAQKQLIKTVASEMRWTQSILRDFLRTHFQCETVDQIGSSARAMEAIRKLKFYKAEKTRRQRRVQ